MHLWKRKEMDIYISDDLIAQRSDAKKVNAAIDETMQDFLRKNPDIAEGIALYGALTGLKRIAVLDAHGGVKDGLWFFSDGKKGVKMQSWIDGCDGKYAALLITACNVGGVTPRSKKSMLIVPDKDVAGHLGTRSSDAEENAVFTMIVPEIGEIDSYSVEYFLKKWRAELAARKNK